MGSMLAFEKKYSDISNSELWELLKQKVETEKMTTDFLIGVGKICEKGILLSKDIISFFPNFTLHDITHIQNVCRWMINLLGDRKNELSATEAALLVMAACCHDVGMSVSVDQEKSLKKDPESACWQRHFAIFPKDEEEYKKTGEITPKILRNYVRVNHHTRISEQIKSDEWPAELTEQSITWDNLIDLCKSHGEDLRVIEPPENADYDLRFCAVLLRLADILDFDSTRAPDALFKHLRLDSPEDYEHSISQLEWMKNRSGGFGKINVSNGTIQFNGVYSSIQLEIQVEEYKKWVIKEFNDCAKSLSMYSGKWSNLKLPYKISNNIVRQGYKFGDFRLTMDEDQVRKLLVGQNLYNDPGVFVRELLQNSIDAVLTRRELDPYYKSDEEKIIIRTWRDNEGYDWFRIEDNGTGMDENIILNYFLKIGRSYYTSDDYIAERRHYKTGISSFNPISRFGIGILSCFINDPKNNRLEVSTKRYSHLPDVSNPAIRLNVDGLHGYYYFAEENKQNEHDVGFKPIHSPDETVSTGYRADVGTTICVRTNLYQSNIHSFREIVDRYVQFPDVEIEYIGQDGYKKYPSRKGLVDRINRLGSYNPKTGCILIKHDLPSHVVNEVKTLLPEIKRIDSLSLNLSYCSLNKLSVSDNLDGAAIFIDTEAHVEIDKSMVYEDVEYKLGFKCRAICEHDKGKILFAYGTEYSEELGRKIEKNRLESIKPYNRLMSDVDMYYDSLATDGENMRKYLCEQYDITEEQISEVIEQVKDIREIKRLYEEAKRECGIEISLTDISKLLSEDELYLWDIITKVSTYDNKEHYYSIISTSYNGIISDTSDLLGLDNDCTLGAVLLLSGEDYYPDVNMARDKIITLPLQAILDLDHITQCINNRISWRYETRIMNMLKSGRYDYVTEKEYYTFLNEHPEWESIVKYDGKTVEELNSGMTISVSSKDSNIQSNIKIAILKKHFNVTFLMDAWMRGYEFLLSDKTDDIVPLDFPVQLFFNFREYIQGVVSGGKLNVKHPFVKWLIKNQTLLLERVPGIYNNLIDNILHPNSMGVTKAITAMLNQVKRLNICEVNDEVFPS